MDILKSKSWLCKILLPNQCSIEQNHLPLTRDKRKSQKIITIGNENRMINWPLHRNDMKRRNNYQNEIRNISFILFVHFVNTK